MSDHNQIVTELVSLADHPLVQSISLSSLIATFFGYLPHVTALVVLVYYCFLIRKEWRHRRD